MSGVLVRPGARNRVLPPPSPGFKRGYLFGEMPRLAELRIEIALDGKKVGEKDGGKWFIDKTPLARYTFKPPEYQDGPTSVRVDFEGHLAGELKEAARDKRVRRVLDVGVGSGSQWLEVIGNRRLEFWATNLTEEAVHPAMGAFTRICAAADLHKFFPGDYFDRVVSHYGIWEQGTDGTENIVWVLRPGGQALVSGDTAMPPLRDSHIYRIVAIDKPDANNHWFYWIEKTCSNDGIVALAGSTG